MMKKTVIGDIELIEPSPELVELTKAIIEQNGMILKMNADLLKILNSPAFVVKAEAE